MSEPILRRKLSHEVASRLAEGIASGAQAPGTQLPSERTLMARYGVGRPAVREALQALQQKGLIRILHGERARVVTPTADGVVEGVSAAMVQLLGADPAGLADLKEARFLLEVGLARLAAERTTPEGIAGLRAALRACQAARGAGPAFIAADMAFHRQIAALAGNGLIASVCGGMLHWLTQFKQDMVSVRGADRLTLDEHSRIASAIAARDPAEAGAAMADHLRRANALYAVLEAGGGAK